MRQRTVRYAGLTDIMPDSQRRPISPGDLCAMVRTPLDGVECYVEKLIAEEQVELQPGGLVAPRRRSPS